MSKLVAGLGGAALLVLGMAPAAVAASLGPDAAACRTAGTPAALVHVNGLKSRTGSVRVQVYGPNPADFLVKGRWLKRVDVAVPAAGGVEVCVRLPRPGNYAIAVRHDVDGAGKSGWNDGGGFSRNPKISLFDLKPRFEEVVVPVGPAPRSLSVVMNYRHGLSVGPVASN